LEEISKEDLKEGKKQLEGVIILCWVMAIITGFVVFLGLGRGLHPGGLFTGYFDGAINMYRVSDIIKNIVTFPINMAYSMILPALYVLELIGLYKRRSFAVPLGRAVLVVTMVLFFPVGTIFGAILWKRFNNPVSKKYLNYHEKP